MQLLSAEEHRLVLDVVLRDIGEVLDIPRFRLRLHVVVVVDE